jgi:hypothetical protein
MKRSTLISLLSLLPLSLAACGSDASQPGDCTPATSGTTAKKWVLNKMTMPSDNKTYAYDLVGATPPKKTNALGDIVAALMPAGLDVQMGVDMAISAGQVALLITTNSTDPNFASDKCASLELQTGKPMTPDFTKVQNWTVDTSVTPATFAGPISGSKFVSAATSTTKMPVTAQISLPLVPMADPLPLTVYGSHLEYTYTAAGISGQLNGAIKKTDIDTKVIPRVANILESKIKTDAAGSGLTATDKQILKLFDDGGTSGGDMSCPATAVPGGTPAPGCKNPSYALDNAGGCAKAGDGIIEECEIANSNTIQTVLQPDVQLFAADGVTWMPNPTGKPKDSMSLGIAFTAVPATF